MNDQPINPSIPSHQPHKQSFLIPFSQQPHSQQPHRNEISEEIQLTSICSKLALLTLRFPELRILWARSSHCTVQLFQALKVNNAPVDVAKALVSCLRLLLFRIGGCLCQGRLPLTLTPPSVPLPLCNAPRNK